MGLSPPFAEVDGVSFQVARPPSYNDPNRLSGAKLRRTLSFGPRRIAKTLSARQSDGVPPLPRRSTLRSMKTVSYFFLPNRRIVHQVQR
jgi:hypothetical protein